MSDFFNTLKEQTKQEQNYLLAAPIIQRVFKGEASLEEYASFLAQAYHHVKHTVPLMMSVGARLTDDQEWLREAVAEYIEEEIGHHNLELFLDIVQDFLARPRFQGWVHSVMETELQGTAGTLRKNADFFQDSTILLIHADNWCQCQFSNFIEFKKLIFPFGRRNKDKYLTKNIFIVNFIRVDSLKRIR